jgi:hypothetical protein
MRRSIRDASSRERRGVTGGGERFGLGEQTNSSRPAIGRLARTTISSLDDRSRKWRRIGIFGRTMVHHFDKEEDAVHMFLDLLRTKLGARL